MGEHDGVVVDVDGTDIRSHRPGDLVDVLLRRQACANIQELPDALPRAAAAAGVPAGQALAGRHR